MLHCQSISNTLLTHAHARAHTHTELDIDDNENGSNVVGDRVKGQKETQGQDISGDALHS